MTPFGDALASPQGDTKEFGFNLSLLKDKFNLRVNWFETNVTGQTFSPAPLFGQAINNAILQRADALQLESLFADQPSFTSMRDIATKLVASGVTDEPEITRVLGGITDERA